MTELSFFDTSVFIRRMKGSVRLEKRANKPCHPNLTALVGNLLTVRQIIPELSKAR